MTYFLPWNTKGDALKDILVTFFSPFKYNEWGLKVSSFKKTEKHHQNIMKTAHLTCVLYFKSSLSEYIFLVTNCPKC